MRALLHRRQRRAAEERGSASEATQPATSGAGHRCIQLCDSATRWCRLRTTAPANRMVHDEPALLPLWRASDRQRFHPRVRSSARIGCVATAQLRAVMSVRSHRPILVRRPQRRRWRPTPPAGVAVTAALAFNSVNRHRTHRAAVDPNVLTFAQTSRLSLQRPRPATRANLPDPCPNFEISFLAVK